MNLYEINKGILDLVDQETGEIKDFQALQDLLLAKEEKIENVACYIKNIESDIQALETEIKNMKERAELKKKQKDRLSEYLKSFMLQEGRNKFETPKCRVSFRKCKSVDVKDEKELLFFLQLNGMTDLYTVPEVQPKVNKAEIKKYLKEHDKENLPYVEIVENTSMQIK